VSCDLSRQAIESRGPYEDLNGCLLKSGLLATLRFFFAKKQVDECNGDFSTTMHYGLVQKPF
jgi:hypothetical protein